MTTHARRAALALAAAAVLSCAACTSSSGGTGSGSGATTPAGGAPSTATSSAGGAATPTGTTPSSSPRSTATSTAPASTSAPVSPPAGVTTPASIAHPEWCVDGEITTTSQEAPGGGAAGHNGILLLFKNSSDRTCVLYGYPGADALDAAGHTVSHAQRSLTGYIGGAYSGLHDVSLAPGDSASTYVEGDIGDGSAACSSGTRLAVTPPNLLHPTLLPQAPYVCQFTIHPVVAGTSGR